ncbi:MAG: hypothetical protein GY719_27380 [bacterium]|nr:hypothetical protein [bacterium]
MRVTMKALFILLLITCAGVVFAGGTPDGEPPSVEEDCDIYRNQPGPAFGLCNAYCEAMDCELANDGDPNTNPNANERACERVLARFVDATNGDDPPCEGAGEECPCFTTWTDPEPDNSIWQNFADGPPPTVVSCFDDGTNVAVSDGTDFAQVATDCDPDTPGLQRCCSVTFPGGQGEGITLTFPLTADEEVATCASTLRGSIPMTLNCLP